MRHMAQAVIVIVAGAFVAWLAQVIPWAVRYDRTRTYE